MKERYSDRKMEDSNNPEITAAVVMRPEDRRAIELEELRQKQLAKAVHGKLDGKGQKAITAEDWQEQQKHLTKLNKKQKEDAIAKMQSHNYRAENNSGINAVVKNELKRMEKEATTNLHSYNAKPEAILSHQVKKIPKNSGSPPSEHVVCNPAVMDDEIRRDSSQKLLFNDEDGFETDFDDVGNVQDCDINDIFPISDGFVPPINNDESLPSQAKSEGSNSYEKNSPQKSLNSQCSSEWVVLSNDDNESSKDDERNKNNFEESDISSNNVEVSMKNFEKSVSNELSAMKADVNEDEIDESNYFPRNFLDTDCGIDRQDNRRECVISSVICMSPELEQKEQEEKREEWLETNVSACFGLLTDRAEASSIKSHFTLTGNSIIENILMRLKAATITSLQNDIETGNIILEESPQILSVESDASYSAPCERSFVVRSIVRIRIPLRLKVGFMSDISIIERIVHTALKGSITSSN